MINYSMYEMLILKLFFCTYKVSYVFILCLRGGWIQTNITPVSIRRCNMPSWMLSFLFLHRELREYARLFCCHTQLPSAVPSLSRGGREGGIPQFLSFFSLLSSPLLFLPLTFLFHSQWLFRDERRLDEASRSTSSY